jgi:hypothetical protein
LATLTCDPKQLDIHIENHFLSLEEEVIPIDRFLMTGKGCQYVYRPGLKNTKVWSIGTYQLRNRKGLSIAQLYVEPFQII